MNMDVNPRILCVYVSLIKKQLISFLTAWMWERKTSDLSPKCTLDHARFAGLNNRYECLQYEFYFPKRSFEVLCQLQMASEPDPEAFISQNALVFLAYLGIMRSRTKDLHVPLSLAWSCNPWINLGKLNEVKWPSFLSCSCDSPH